MDLEDIFAHLSSGILYLIAILLYLETTAVGIALPSMILLGWAD
jgi:hypothetical protein